MDKYLYRELTSEWLCYHEESLEIPLPNNVLIQQIHEILLASAQDASLPPSKQQGNNFFKKHPSHPLFFLLAKAPNKQNSMQENCKTNNDSNKELRSMQHCIVTLHWKGHIEDLMVASKEQSSTLVKLVQASNKQSSDVIIDFWPGHD